MSAFLPILAWVASCCAYAASCAIYGALGVELPLSAEGFVAATGVLTFSMLGVFTE